MKKYQILVGQLKISEDPEKIAAAGAIEDLIEEVSGISSTLRSWFDISKKTEENLEETLIGGLQSYLRVSKSGGMPSDLADACEAVLADYIRLYAGKHLIPILRGIAEANKKGLNDANV